MAGPGSGLQDIKEGKDYHFPVEEEAVLGAPRGGVLLGSGPGWQCRGQQLVQKEPADNSTWSVL